MRIAEWGMADCGLRIAEWWMAECGNAAMRINEKLMKDQCVVVVGARWSMLPELWTDLHNLRPKRPSISYRAPIVLPIVLFIVFGIVFGMVFWAWCFGIVFGNGVWQWGRDTRLMAI